MKKLLGSTLLVLLSAGNAFAAKTVTCQLPAGFNESRTLVISGTNTQSVVYKVQGDTVASSRQVTLLDGQACDIEDDSVICFDAQGTADKIFVMSSTILMLPSSKQAIDAVKSAGLSLADNTVDGEIFEQSLLLNATKCSIENK